MMLLNDIVPSDKVLVLKGNDRVPFSTLQFDSRKIEEGAVFFAIKGVQVDGHRFIDKAIAQGAKAIVLEDLPTDIQQDICYIQVKNTSLVMGEMAANYFDHPSKQLKLVGITGTNGKTSTATLLYKLFQGLGYKTGLISTVENKIGNNTKPATHTTPDAIALQALLAEMASFGCEYVFMEVSSHAIDQNRIAGAHFSGGVFTNITHDHLDYHKTFINYINAKKKFFDDLPKVAFALTNIDDKRGEVMLQNTQAKKISYALRKVADVKAKIIENQLEGLHLELDGKDYHGRLIGEFNAYNTLAVYSTAVLLGANKDEVMTILSGLTTAEGRFDYQRAGDKIGIVDYAHTPDALEKVLKTINKLKTDGQVITVVGCGGDRDKKKRPIMAAIACDWSDQVILTSDNPRTESPETILKEMEAGVPITDRRKVLVISDRAQAIKTACTISKDRDIILVAGKGHEKYQDINGVKHPFDDKAKLKMYL